jgi:hypothetical protein
LCRSASIADANQNTHYYAYFNNDRHRNGYADQNTN